MLKGEKILYMKTKNGLEVMAKVSDIFNIPKGDKIDSLVIGEKFTAKKGRK